jgi:DNA-binding NarL/FixJ family response regulator
LERAIADATVVVSMTEPVSPAPATRRVRRHYLTPRELEVIRLIAGGLSDREIGAQLFISTRTASTHVANILTKLGLRARAEVAVYAVRNRLV